MNMKECLGYKTKIKSPCVIRHESETLTDSSMKIEGHKCKIKKEKNFSGIVGL